MPEENVNKKISELDEVIEIDGTHFIPVSSEVLGTGRASSELFAEFIENKQHDSFIKCEVGKIENKSIYSIITMKKARIRADLVPVSTTDLIDGQKLQTSMTVQDFALRNKPMLVCNINPTDNVIYNGILYGNDWASSAGSRTGMYGTTADGNIVCQRYGSFSNMLSLGAVSAIGSWQPLILDDAIIPIADYSTFNTPNPWQILGEDDENFYLFSSYCRFGEYVGMTLQEAQEFCINRNWQNAYAFDGGGSVQVFGGKPYTNHSTLYDANRSYRKQYMVLVFSERDENDGN